MNCIGPTARSKRWSPSSCPASVSRIRVVPSRPSRRSADDGWSRDTLLARGAAGVLAVVGLDPADGGDHLPGQVAGLVGGVDDGRPRGGTPRARRRGCPRDWRTGPPTSPTWPVLGTARSGAVIVGNSAGGAVSAMVGNSSRTPPGAEAGSPTVRLRAMPRGTTDAVTSARRVQLGRPPRRGCRRCHFRPCSLLSVNTGSTPQLVPVAGPLPCVDDDEFSGSAPTPTVTPKRRGGIAPIGSFVISPHVRSGDQQGRRDGAAWRPSVRPRSVYPTTRGGTLLNDQPPGAQPRRPPTGSGDGYYPATGVFVCFEGGEGAGKSTQSRALRAWLEAQGYPVVLTFEPGDTEVGRQLRRIVLDPATGALSDRTEALLYAADKAEHVDTVVLPGTARRARGDHRPLRRLHPGLPGGRPVACRSRRSRRWPGGRPMICGRT